MVQNIFGFVYESYCFERLHFVLRASLANDRVQLRIFTSHAHLCPKCQLDKMYIVRSTYAAVSSATMCVITVDAVLNGATTF